jgi:hypothetical protein
MSFLLGQMLSASGVSFVEARGKLSAAGLSDVEIVVPDDNSKEACETWCRRRKIAGTVRVATAEELTRHQEMTW